jgi:cyclin C
MVIGSLLNEMAANYWASTQRRHWEFSRESLAEVRQQLEDEEPNLSQQYPLPDRRHLSLFFNQRMLSDEEVGTYTDPV